MLISVFYVKHAVCTSLLWYPLRGEFCTPFSYCAYIHPPMVQLEITAPAITGSRAARTVLSVSDILPYVGIQSDIFLLKLWVT